jgi:hypothetical protein
MSVNRTIGAPVVAGGGVVVVPANVTLTSRGSAMTTEHVEALPAQEPPQAETLPPLPGVAVSATVEPILKKAVQCVVVAAAVQLMPEGLEVTLPPLPTQISNS